MQHFVLGVEGWCWKVPFEYVTRQLMVCIFMFVSAATPFDPLLPAKGSTLRGGILTLFLVLLISTLIMSQFVSKNLKISPNF